MKTVLLRFARSGFGGLLLRFALNIAPALAPVQLTYRSRTLFVFPHPVPSYPDHLLLVPLPPIVGLQALTNDHTPVLSEILQVSHQIVEKRSIPRGWRLVANGGAYQEVGILHFHLISDHQPE